MTKKVLRIAKPLVIMGSILALAFLCGCVGTPLYSPTACIEADPTIGYAPLTVSFDASCSSAEGVSPPPSGMFSYGWDFDDDSAAAHGMTVEHTFVEPGTYEVQVVLIYTEGQKAGIPAAGGTRTVTVLPAE